MISAIEYIQLKAFARQDGFFLGCLWIVTFACFIGSIKMPDLQLGFIAGIIATPFVVYYRLKHFRDKVLDGSISYRRAVSFIALTMIYASVIMAAATYAYFYFFDHGLFVSTLQESIALPEIRHSFAQAGMDAKQLDEQMAMIAQTRPIDFAFSVLSNGIILAFTFSLIIGFIGKKRVSKA